MAGFLGRMFTASQTLPLEPAAVDGLESPLVPVRFRPRLLADLAHEHESVRGAMRAVLDACRSRDEDAQIIGLQRFAETFRRVCLAKSVQLYPYLHWALQHDRMATIQLKMIHADLQRSVHGIEALLGECLGAPWLSERRRHVVADISKLAHRLGALLRQEESSVLPLYLPPGQYQYVRAALPV